MFEKKKKRKESKKVKKKRKGILKRKKTGIAGFQRPNKKTSRENSPEENRLESQSEHYLVGPLRSAMW